MDETTRVAINAMMEKMDALEKRIEGHLELPPEDRIEIFPDEDEEGGASGGAPGANAGMFAWNEEERKMGPGGVLVGRNWIDVTPQGEKSDGTYYLKVTLSANQTSTEITSTNSGTTDTSCCIPIYKIEDGAIKEDYRGAFVVQCWEA